MRLFEIKLVNQEAAAYAVKMWHYSKTLPKIKLIRFGVFENNEFIGVIIFSPGASPFLGYSIGLDQTEVCELTRIALSKHETPVSQLVAECLRKLKLLNPGIRCVVSFADPKEGHKGGIYQAGNWIFTGVSSQVVEYFLDGRWAHTRGVYNRKDRPFAPTRTTPGKFRYLFPLDKKMRRQLIPLGLKYPNAIEGLEESRSNSVTEELVQSQPIARKNQDASR